MRVAGAVGVVHLASAIFLIGCAGSATRATSPNPVTEPPELGPVNVLTLPTVVERRLGNGLRVLIVEHHELPLADLLLVVRTGSEADPLQKEGLATLVGSLLDEGTINRSALQIAEQIGFLGISLRTTAGWDASRVTLHTPVAQLDSALALMADVTLRPSFSADELERLRKERLTALLQLRDRGPAIADQAYSHVVFGGDHPYGRPQLGDEASVGSLTRDDVLRFYQTYYRPNDAALIVVGDVRPDEIQQRLERWFGRWAPGPVPATRFPPAPIARAATVHLVDKPGAAQSSFRIGTVGVPRATEDFFPIQVMNTVLGGAFTSRLNQNLRETKGYTYGARSAFDMRRSAGLFTARAEIVTAKSDSALIEFMKELRNIRELVSRVELEKAKNYIQLSLPGAVETTFGIASRLATIALYDLPLDYLNMFSQRIAAVTQADVRRVALKHVRPEEMDIVLVGDLEQIESGIRALGVGNVILRDLSGRSALP